MAQRLLVSCCCEEFQKHGVNFSALDMLRAEIAKGSLCSKIKRLSSRKVWTESISKSVGTLLWQLPYL